MEPLGHAVDEKVDDVKLSQVAGGELGVVLPQPLGQLGYSGPRQKQLLVPAGEGVLDVTGGAAAGQHFHRQALELRRAALDVPVDFGAERLVAARDLRCAVLDGALGGLDAGDAGAVAVSAAFLDSVLVVVVPPQGVSGLFLEGFLDDEAGCGTDEIRAAFGTDEASADEIFKLLTCAVGGGLSVSHDGSPMLVAGAGDARGMCLGCGARRPPAKLSSRL